MDSGYTNMKAVYIKTQLKNLINVTKIVTIHYYEFDKNFVFSGESHNFWEMVYVDKGQVVVKSEKNEILLTQGDVIFHEPNEFHAIKAWDSEPNFFVISFVCNSPAMVYFKKFYTKLNKTLKPFIAGIIQEAEATYVIPKNNPDLKVLTKKENAIIGGEQLIKTYMEQLLILLIRDINKVGKMEVLSNKESVQNHLILEIKAYIERNYEKQFQIADVCSELGYSKSYLCKLFQEQTGNTIADYAMRRKIHHAKRLIRENNLNFSQISEKLSFDNPQYFSRVFKRITKMSPTEFKQTLKLDT